MMRPNLLHICQILQVFSVNKNFCKIVVNQAFVLLGRLRLGLLDSIKEGCQIVMKNGTCHIATQILGSMWCILMANCRSMDPLVMYT